MINITRWAIDETRVVPQQQNTHFIPDVSPYPSSGSVHLANNSSKAFIVTRHRVLHELELDVREDGLATQGFSDYANRHHCQKNYRLSMNGRRVVGIYTKCDAESDASLSKSMEEQSESLRLNRTRTELFFADLSGATDQVQTIELNYLDSHSPLNSPLDYGHNVTFSPDLSMLRAGQHIFDLAAPDQPPLWFRESPLPRLRNEADLSMVFSPCNGYLTFFERNIVKTKDEPATFGLFRVCRSARSIERISIISLEDLIADVVAVDFHPTLPLLMLTCVPYRKSDVKYLAESIKVVEIDLEVLRPVQLTLPEDVLDMIAT